MDFIPYGRQDICKEDIEAVIAALKAPFITQGPRVEQFEKDLSSAVGSKYSVAVTNGTAALHLACLALGVGPEDWVWTSPISFVASSNCALYCGASIDFVDINPTTWNMSPQALEEKLKLAEQQNRLPKVVIPVHLCGLSCDMEKIKDLSNRYGFSIIEDACHALGGSYKSQKVGSCQYSDIACSSFHPVKNITTGEGGCCFTNDSDLYEKLLLLRSHGITKNPAQMTKPSEGSWYYQQLQLGFNYRITDIQSALGSSQLQRLDKKMAKRQAIAKRYFQELEGLPLTLPAQPTNNQSAYHLFVIRVLNSKRDSLFQHLRNSNIGVNLHYIPIHTQPYYQSLQMDFGPLPHAEAYYQEAISLPMFPTLKNEEQSYVIQTIKSFLSK